MRGFLAEHAFTVDDAGAIDQTVHRAERGERRRDRGLGTRLVGDIGADESRGAAELGRQRLALGFLQIGKHGLAAVADHHARRAGSQARRAPGDEKYAVANLHRGYPRCVRVCD